MDDETILAQASDMIQQQQRTNHQSDGVRKIDATIDRLLTKLDRVPELTPEMNAELGRLDSLRETALREHAWSGLCGRLGRRYADASLETFVARTQLQSDVAQRVAAYVQDLGENLRDGRSVLLYGPPGTGKDHLATAIMRAAILDAGAKVEWTDGADFYGAMRDNIDVGGSSESRLLARFRDPDLLAISDPVPPLGKVDSAFQLSMLFRVIDRRYRDKRATMMTLNVASRQEAEQRLSPNIVDRLGHDALVLHCNWPSYRR